MNQREVDNPILTQYIATLRRDNAALLEALTEGLNHAEGNAMHPISQEQRHAWIDKARAAIALAKGEST